MTLNKQIWAIILEKQHLYHWCNLMKFWTTIALSKNVTNAPKGALTPNLKNVEVTVQNKNYFIVENSLDKIKVWKINKEQKLQKYYAWFLSTSLLLNEIYLPMKFQVSSLNTFWVILRTKFKNENEQRAITLKVWSFELWFLCTALLLNEIYLPMKFHVDALHSFKVMLRTKKGQTDGRTDGQVDYYMPPFGSIKHTHYNW